MESEKLAEVKCRQCSRIFLISKVEDHDIICECGELYFASDFIDLPKCYTLLRNPASQNNQGGGVT